MEEKETIKEADSREKGLDREALEEYALSVFDPYKRYIQEIKNIPVLSREEEKRLALLYTKKGDEEAAYRLIISNLRLVVKIAMEFHRSWIKNISDMIQEGNIGLMEALKRYDPYKDVRFSSYASFWIRAYIIKFIMDNYSLIKIGKTQAQRKLFFNLNKEKERLANMGFDFDPKLLAENLNVKESEINEMELRLDNPIMSLDEPIKDDSSRKHIDAMAYEEEPIVDRLAREQMEDMVNEKIAIFKMSLNDKERFILENRIYTESPMNLREIGERLDFSRERARQIESNVLKKLKVFLKEALPDMDLSGF